MINYLNLEEYHLINRLFLFLIDILGVWLIAWVYFADPKKKFNRLFSWLAISILLWVNAGYFLSYSESFKQALCLARFAPSAVFIFLIAFYFFSLNFPKEKTKKSKIDKFIFLLGLTLAILTFFSSLIIKDVQFTEWGTNPIFTSSGKFIFYTIVLSFTVFAFLQIFKKYFTLSKKEKLKTQYFLVGLFIFVVMNLIFNVAFPIWRNSIQYWQLGNYSAIFLLAFTAYAIVKRELFGIRVVLTTLLVGLISLLIFIDIIFLTQEVLTKLFKALLLVLFLYFGYLLIKGVVREIQYRERLQKAYRDLKGLDEAKSEFLSITSHQLRTPLSAIKGYISMILEGSYGKLPERARQSIENVYQSNERLIKLVNDILNVSRIEAGRIEIKFQKVSLEEIINSVVKELKHEAERKNIYLKFEKPSKPLPRVTVDEDKIRHVILNIVDNAIRYTNKGGITVQAEVKNSSKIIIIVKDTGLGMTGKEISELFKSFSRGIAGNRLYTGGAGLGLYIAKKFVDIHGGKISAESKGIGKGSTFYVEIPIFEQSEKTRF